MIYSDIQIKIKEGIMITVKVKRIRKYDKEFVTYKTSVSSEPLTIQFRSNILKFSGALEDQIRGKINDHMEIIIEKEEIKCNQY